jgi:hypothetical protein
VQPPFVGSLTGTVADGFLWCRVVVWDRSEWWDTSLTAMVGDANGCKLIFNWVRDIRLRALRALARDERQ